MARRLAGGCSILRGVGLWLQEARMLPQPESGSAEQPRDVTWLPECLVKYMLKRYFIIARKCFSIVCNRVRVSSQIRTGSKPETLAAPDSKRFGSQMENLDVTLPPHIFFSIYTPSPILTPLSCFNFILLCSHVSNHVMVSKPSGQRCLFQSQLSFRNQLTDE